MGRQRSDTVGSAVYHAETIRMDVQKRSDGHLIRWQCLRCRRPGPWHERDRTRGRYIYRAMVNGFERHLERRHPEFTLHDTADPLL